MTEQQLRNHVVSIAKGWLGRKEANGSHKVIIDTYNAHTPRARNYKVRYTDAWCATFVSAVFIEAGLTDIAPTECSCFQMIELYKKIGRWMEADGYLPSPGDVIMYDWDDTGVGENTGAPEHVGIVVSVSGKTMRIIEGNMTDAVGYRNIAVNGKYIRGYCLPDYKSKEDFMTEKEFYEMFAKAMKTYEAERDKNSASSVHTAAWSKAKNKGVLDGSRPKAPLTREQAATVLERLGLL